MSRSANYTKRDYEPCFGNMQQQTTGAAALFVSNVKNPDDFHSATHALVRSMIMDRWDFHFSGDDDFTLSEFLIKIEINAKADNLCKDDVFLTFSRLLRGTALHWYEAYYDTFTNWTDLVWAMKDRFQPIEYDYTLREEIKLRVQLPDEPAQIYLTHMQKLFRKLDPPVHEEDKVFIIQKNMLPMYTMQLIIRNIKTVNHIMKLCKLIDEQGMGVPRTEPLEPACYPPKKAPVVIKQEKRNVTLNQPRPLLSATAAALALKLPVAASPNTSNKEASTSREARKSASSTNIIGQ